MSKILCWFSCGAAYFMKIRKDFPEIFYKLADIELRKNAHLLKLKGKRISLYDLPYEEMRFLADESENFECGLLC